MEDNRWNKRLIKRDVHPKTKKKNYYHWWLTMKQITDHNGRHPMHPDDAYNLGWLSMTQMIVHDEGFSWKPVKEFDFGWLSMKQTTDHDEDKFEKPYEFYDLGRLSKKQTTEIIKRWPLGLAVGYDNVWLWMKQTADINDCLSMEMMER